MVVWEDEVGYPTLQWSLRVNQADVMPFTYKNNERGRTAMQFNLSSKIQSKITTAERILTQVCAVILALMTAVVLIGVFFRYVLNNALSWTEELARYMMIFVGLFGSALALLRDEHAGLSIVLHKMPPKVQKLSRMATYLLIGLFAYIMAYYGFILTFSSNATAQIFPIPMWLPLSMVPTSGLAILLVSIFKILSELRGGM